MVSPLCAKGLICSKVIALTQVGDNFARHATMTLRSHSDVYVFKLVSELKASHWMRPVLVLYDIMTLYQQS